MSKIANAINKQNNTINKKIDHLINEKIRNKDFRRWNGKKIISIVEWEEMKKKGRLNKLLDFIPDDFLEHALSNIPERFEISPEKRKEWIHAYFSYMSENKKAGFGKRICEKCILYPNPKRGAFWLRDVMGRDYAKGESDKNYQCEIVNYFKCPYDQKDVTQYLMSLEKMCNIIQDALNFAYRDSPSHATYMQETDFEKGTVERTSILDPTPTCEEWINLSFCYEKYSKVQIFYIEDIYKTITDEKKLDLLLEQYINSLFNAYSHGSKEFIEFEKEKDELRQYKEHILTNCVVFRKEIKLEDVHGISGETLEKEKIERQRLEDIKKAVLQEHPEWEDFINKPKYGKCLTCDGFTNIHCKKCDIWVCHLHWGEHSEFHTGRKHHLSNDIG